MAPLGNLPHPQGGDYSTVSPIIVALMVGMVFIVASSLLVIFTILWVGYLTRTDQRGLRQSEVGDDERDAHQDIPPPPYHQGGSTIQSIPSSASSIRQDDYYNTDTEGEGETFPIHTENNIRNYGGIDNTPTSSAIVRRYTDTQPRNVSSSNYPPSSPSSSAS